MNETAELLYPSLRMLFSCQWRPPLFKSLKSDHGQFWFDYSRRVMTCGNLWFPEERMWMRYMAGPVSGSRLLAPGLAFPTTHLLNVALLSQTVSCIQWCQESTSLTLKSKFFLLQLSKRLAFSKHFVISFDSKPSETGYYYHPPLQIRQEAQRV